jgi:WD40 repeat protein/serine/threonine protein kinase
MVRCPFCQADLSRLLPTAENCPQCGRAVESGALRTLADDSAEMAFDDPLATVESKDLAEGEIVQGSAHAWSAESIEKTVQSEEFMTPDPSAADSGKTVAADDFTDAANDRTVQSDEFSWSDANEERPFSAPGADPGKTIAADDLRGADVDQTVQSEEFALSDADPKAGWFGNQRTVMGDDADISGSDRTLLTEDLPPDAVKTMQTMWSGAFQGPTHPGMSIKGAATSGSDVPGSSLVIKQRQLSSPGEKTVGQKDAEYELIRVLGEGGMGVVYDARQTSVDRSVAVKMLKPRTSTDERQRQKFLAEAVVTGDLDHPNIVPIYDVGTSERGMLFYAMKKVKGTPWMKLLPQKSQAENLEILMKVADAVGFAHARGVIHRDLKPENVMLGDFGEVLVMDWGLALPAPGYSKSSTISPAHSMGGTPAYMAPEMASGPIEKISFASDVYLLGAILFEILTGRPPHTGKNTMQCLFAAAKNDIRATDKTGELMDIARKSMATEPKDRYDGVRGFQDAIRDYQSHTESIALSTRAAEEMQKAEQSDDYRDYARSLFAYEEALTLWDGNSRARTGLAEIQLQYASSALRKGDFDLGASLLDSTRPNHASLLGQLKAASHERAARQQRLQALKRLAAGMVALFVVSVTVAFFWIRSERDRAVVAEVEASNQRDKAVAAEEEASEQRDKALVAEKDASNQRDIAVSAEKEASDQRDKAVAAEKEARLAQARAEEERQKAVLAKQKEEYEAYIARIGLAAAKIDENAFGSARELLEGCRPELQNWEWGRLMYLCGQSVRDIEAPAPLDAAAFSPDGSTFITGGWNHSADLWDTATGKHLRAFPHGGLYVHAVAYSPIDRLIATGSNDRTGYLRLCNADTGAILRLFSGHQDAVLSVTFSKDGQRLLSTSYDKTARLWDVASGRELHVFAGHNWWVWSAAFSPDETEIITASQDGSAILWSTETGEQKGQFLGHRGPVYTAAYAPDGRVATAGYDKRILLWNPADLKPFDFRKLAEGARLELPPYATLEGHGAGVRSVSFSKDGTLVLSGSHDNTVKVWDAATTRTLKTFRGHNSWVRACAFSPDYRMILSVGHDHRALLWSITDYEEVRVLQGRILEGHDDAVLAASFSRDGQSIVTASRDRTARTWDFRTGRPIRSFEEGHAFLASNAAFFPDGKRLVTSAVDNTSRFWDITSGTETGRAEHTGRSAALALSHDSKWLLTGSDDKTAKLWDVTKTDSPLKVLSGHKFEVTAVAFSPDDAILFTGDANGAGILWDKATGAVLRKLRSHTRKITAAVFLPDGKRLLTASNDKTVGQWDIATGTELVELGLKHPDAVLSLALLPQSRRVLTSCADEGVRLWDIDTAKTIATLPGTGVVNTVAVAPDGQLALTANSEERTVRVWDIKTGREILAPTGKDRLGAFLDFNRIGRGGQLWSAAFSPDGDSVLTVGGAEARLWNLHDGSERISLSPNGIVASASFSPDGKQIVTGSWDNSARIWNAETGHAEKKLIGQHKGFVNTAVYSPDGRAILTASDDRTAVLWSASDGAVERVFEGHSGAVHSAAFSPDGTRILTASADKSARLWDRATGAEIRRFEGHAWGVRSAAFSADGAKIITGSDDNTARVWSIEGEQPPLVLDGHTAAVSSVAFLPDAKGSRVITGSFDYTAKLWDAVTGKEILTLKGHSQEVTCVNASPSGRYLLTGSRDGTALVWLTVEWPEKSPVQAAGRTPFGTRGNNRPLTKKP